MREGHELGNHTYDHVDCAHEVEHEVVRDQIARTSATIERVTGVAPRLIRPPYGKDVARVAKIGRELGLASTVLWSAQAWDWEEPRPEQIVERVLRDVAPGAIVVLHDGAPPYDARSRDGTVAALAQLLPRLRGDGYELVTVSQLLDLR